ncbi:MAG: hypothetical protein GYA17_03285 [Chloroflexi bacterium]|nr:hypothetical protein [Chloroflexota bacterium]
MKSKVWILLSVAALLLAAGCQASPAVALVAEDGAVAPQPAGQAAALEPPEAASPRVSSPTPAPAALEVITAENAVQVQLLAEAGRGLFGIEFALSPDGSRIAVPGSGGILIYEASSGKLLRQIRPGYSVDSLAFSPDGNSLAASYRRPNGETYPADSVAAGLPRYTASVGRWQVADGQELFNRPLAGSGCGELAARQLAFTPDGASILLQESYSLKGETSQGNLCLLSAQDGSLEQAISILPDSGGSLPQSNALSPDGRWLAASAGSQILLYSLPGGELESVIDTATVRPDAFVQAITFLGDGQALATSSTPSQGDNRQKRSVQVWSLANGTLQADLEGDADDILSLASSADGKLLAAGDAGGQVTVWDVARGERVQHLGPLDFQHVWFGAIPAYVWHLAFSPDAQTLFALFNPTTEGIAAEIRAVRLSDGASLASMYSDVATRPGFSPDGRLLAAGGNPDGMVAVWEAASGQPVMQLTGHTGLVNQATFSPDGRLLATASNDGTIRLWDATDGALLHTLEGHTAAVTQAVFSPDGSQLVSCGEDHRVHLWETAGGTLLGTLESSTAPWRTYLAAFSGDGRGVLYANGTINPVSGNRGQLRLWDPTSGEDRLISDTWVTDLLPQAEGSTYVVWAAGEGGVQVGSLQGEALVAEQSGVRSPYGNGALDGFILSPDRSLLVSGNGFGLHLWDFTTHQIAATPKAGGSSYPYGLFAYSPDGRLIAVSGSIIQIWGIRP